MHKEISSRTNDEGIIPIHLSSMVDEGEDQIDLVEPDDGHNQSQHQQQQQPPRRRSAAKLPRSCSVFLVAMCDCVFVLWFVPLPFLYLPTMTEKAYAVTRKVPPPEEEIRRRPRTQYAPVIINAGQGTTGSHSFFYVTCLLSYKLLHWFTMCVPKHAVVEIPHKMQKKNQYLRLKDGWRTLMKTQYNMTVQ